VFYVLEFQNEALGQRMEIKITSQDTGYLLFFALLPEAMESKL